MSLLLTLAIISGASCLGTAFLSRRMGLSRPWRRILTLTAFLLPPAGILLLGVTAAVRSAARGVRNRRTGQDRKDMGRERMLERMSPKEKEAFLRRDGMKEMKEALSRSEAQVDAARLRSAARKDRLMGRPGWDETNLHEDLLYRILLSRQARAERAFASDRRALQAYMLSSSVRETDPSQRYFSIRCNRLSDGTLTFELPFDAGAAVLSEMRLALSKDWGVAVGDLNRECVTEHRSNDFQTISLRIPRTGMDKDIVDSTVFVYDRTRGSLQPAGERVAPEIEKKIYSAVGQFRERVREEAGVNGVFLDQEDMRGFITLHILGLDTVALAFNGIAVAYATAGRDGCIHVKGDDVPAGDRKAMKVASAIEGTLGESRNFGEWLDKAIGILLSPENIRVAADTLEKKARLVRSRSRMKDLAKKILESPENNRKRGIIKRVGD